jgi:deoxycytidylate deaminase
LEKHAGFHRISLSKPIKEELAKLEKNTSPHLFQSPEVTGEMRKKLQDLGNEKRKIQGDYWVQQALQSHPEDKPLVIDGIRNLQEVDSLRQRFASFFLISLYADVGIRRDRCLPQFGQNTRDFDIADSRDSKENLIYGQQVSECVAISDFVLVNNVMGGATDNLLKNIYIKLKDEIELMKGAHEGTMPPGSRSPSPSEAHMAAAYAQSHISQCLKRHVGAVIVSNEGLPLSMGFNENPVGMKSCRSGLGYCFKDDDMNRKLEAMRNFFCPECGKGIQQISSPFECQHCKANLRSKLFPSRNMELCTAIHAEERAIRSLGGRSAEAGTLYTTTFPCFQCARYIVDAKIARVEYVEAYPIKESRKFLEENKVEVVPFEGFKARAFNIIFRQVA